MPTAGSGTSDLVAGVVHRQRSLHPDRLEARIQTTYELSPYLRPHELSVAVSKEGEATIKGMVNEDVDKELAGQIALGVEGIKKVKNDIEVKADYRPVGNRKVDDFSITTAVKSKLLWSKNTDGMDIQVTTVAGTVTLQGKAETAVSRELAVRIALNTNGVHKVDNKLVVASAGSSTTVGGSGESSAVDAGAAIADTWITSKVKSTFMYSSNLDSNDISVSTSKGIVTLSGKLDSGAEQELAIELASNIRGVLSVNADALTYAAR